MNTNSRLHSRVSLSLKVGIAPLLALGLTGCDGLARLVAKPDAKPDVSEVVAEPTAQPPVPEAPKPAEKPVRRTSPLYDWNGDGRTITRIVINTNEQKARFYADEEEVGWSTVATGVAKYPTPTGQFQVMEKVENKRSNLYGKVFGKGGKVIRSSVKVGRDPIPDGARFEGAHMPYFMRLTGDGVGLHAGPIPKPGQPASHGCIRMPSKLAPVVFKHVANGTSVVIEGKGPSYGDYLAKQRAVAAEQKRVAERRAAASAKPAKVAATTAPPKVAQTEPPAIAASPSPVEAKDATAVVQPDVSAAARETRMREPATAVTGTEGTPAAMPETAAESAPTPTAPSAVESKPAPVIPAAASQAQSAAPTPPAPQAATVVAPSTPAPAQAPTEPKPPVATPAPAPTAPSPAPAPAAPTPAPEAAPAPKPEPAAAPAAQPAPPAPKPAPEPPPAQTQPAA